MADYKQGIWIDGEEYKVPFVSVKRTAEFLDASAERLEDGDLDRDLIGVYYNYNAQFGTIHDDDLYQKLYDKLTEPVEFHDITFPTTKGNYSYQAYITTVSDEMEKILSNTVKFKGLSCKFISKKPARTPNT